MKQLVSYKHAISRYEVAIAIKTGYIVHVNGPFLCGEWPDLRIAREWLHHRLPVGEYYIADGGHRCRHSPVVLQESVQQNEVRKFRLIRARHETINGRFKEWGCLKQTYRHAENKHHDVFMAVAVITQAT